MRNITWLLRCYPRRWRERYQEEMLALLEQHPVTFKTFIDLCFGALDAHFCAFYRFRENFILQWVRDHRSLPLIYLCAVAMFLFSTNCWLLLHLWQLLQGGLASQQSPVETFVNTVYWLIVPAVILIALIAMAIITLRQAFQQRHWGTLIFASLCLGLMILISFFPLFPLSLLTAAGAPLEFLLGGLFDDIEIVVFLGCGLFLVGINGARLLRAQRGWPLLLALLTGFLLPAGLVIYSLWGEPNPNVGGYFSPGSLSIGNSVFPSPGDFLQWLFSYFGPYFALSGLSLALVQSQLRKWSWWTTRLFGLLLTALLLFSLAMMVVWDMLHFISGASSILRPTDGWQVGVLFLDILLLVGASALAFGAFISSFSIQPSEEEHLPEPVAV